MDLDDDDTELEDDNAELENLISSCKNTKEPMRIKPNIFCNLLNGPDVQSYQLNERIKFKNPPVPGCDEGYQHRLKYNCFKFFTITTVPITEV